MSDIDRPFHTSRQLFFYSKSFVPDRPATAVRVCMACTPSLTLIPPFESGRGCDGPCHSLIALLLPDIFTEPRQTTIPTPPHMLRTRHALDRGRLWTELDRVQNRLLQPLAIHLGHIPSSPGPPDSKSIPHQLGRCFASRSLQPRIAQTQTLTQKNRVRKASQTLLDPIRRRPVPRSPTQDDPAVPRAPVMGGPDVGAQRNKPGSAGAPPSPRTQWAQAGLGAHVTPHGMRCGATGFPPSSLIPSFLSRVRWVCVSLCV
ncbi:hypothetical protein BD414DRAFT_480983 [Trametes punicea]|nr:hypothetical protein BD414DRAFT_480983 [Trametes punicea]